MKRKRLSDGKPPSKKELEQLAWNSLVRDLTRAAAPRDVEKLLGTVLSAYERADITSRAAAITLLQQGASLRKIGDLLQLSRPVVSALRKSVREAKGYIPRHARWKIEGRKKKQYMKFVPEPRSIVIPPHGKRAFPRRVRIR